LAEIKSRIERSDEAPMKKLPLPEREARRKAQQLALGFPRVLVSESVKIGL
jgi:hypothetical protein